MVLYSLAVGARVAHANFGTKQGTVNRLISEAHTQFSESHSIGRGKIFDTNAARCWSRTTRTSCKKNQLLWLSHYGDVNSCEARTLNDPNCSTPKTAVYQSGGPKNCYCCKSSFCKRTASSWQDLYVYNQIPIISYSQGHNVARTQKLPAGCPKRLALPKATNCPGILKTWRPTKTMRLNTGDAGTH